MIDVATIIFLTIATILTTGMIMAIFYGIAIIIVMSYYAIQDKVTETKRHHEYKFLWYYRMGLHESAAIFKTGRDV